MVGDIDSFAVSIARLTPLIPGLEAKLKTLVDSAAASKDQLA